MPTKKMTPLARAILMRNVAELRLTEWKETARHFRIKWKNEKKFHRKTSELAGKNAGELLDLREINVVLQGDFDARVKQCTKLEREVAELISANRELRSQTTAAQRSENESREALRLTLMGNVEDAMREVSKFGRPVPPEMRVHEMRAWAVRFAESLNIPVVFDRGRQITNDEFNRVVRAVDTKIRGMLHLVNVTPGTQTEEKTDGSA